MTFEGHQCTTALAWRTGGLSDDTGGTGGYGDWWEDATYGLGRRPDWVSMADWTPLTDGAASRLRL